MMRKVLIDIYVNVVPCQKNLRERGVAGSRGTKKNNMDKNRGNFSSPISVFQLDSIIVCI